MRIQRFLGGMLAMVAIVFAVVLYSTTSVRGSDHQDTVYLATQKPGADITDMYVYPSPSNPANVVLQMNVYPLIPPTMITSVALDPSVLYQVRIAHGTYAAGTGFSAKADDTVLQLMASGAGPSQTVNIYGPDKPPMGGTSTTQTLLPLAGSVPFNSTTAPPLANGIRVFAGVRADSFFFDLTQFLKILPDRDYHNHLNGANPPNPNTPQNASFRGFGSATQTSGSATSNSCNITPAFDTLDAFAGPSGSPNPGAPPADGGHFNVISIVVEIPKVVLAPPGQGQVIGVYGTTSMQSSPPAGP